MKVLYISSIINSGGVAKIVKMMAQKCCMSYEDFEADIVCCERPNKETQKEMSRYNIGFLVIDRILRNPFAYTAKIKKIIKNGHYDAIHSNIEYLNWIPCRIGKKCGIKYRVGHAHGQHGRSNTFFFHVMEAIGRRLNCKYTTTRFACSIASGEYVFGKDNFIFLPNFIDYNNIEIIDNIKKEAYSKEFNIVNQKKVGFMGYLGYEKNPFFTVKLARYCSKNNEDLVFIVAGDGIEKERLISESAKEIQKGFIKFIGYRTDNIPLLQFFDVLIMPSFSEGMSMALLEAQICGTPCVVSNGVPITNDLHMGLFFQAKSNNAREWVYLIKKAINNKYEMTFNERLDILSKIGYDSDSIVKKIIDSYKGLK